jgi:hypothetical protein
MSQPLRLLCRREKKKKKKERRKKNRRWAKLKARDNWFKGKQMVDPPEEQNSKSDDYQNSSRRMETSQTEDAT